MASPQSSYPHQNSMAGPNATVNIDEVNFRFGISDISKLTTVSSPEFSIHSVPWKVLAFKNVSKSDPSLGLFLCCANADTTSDWSYVASATFELLSFKSGCDSMRLETGPYIFDQNNKRFGFNNFILWTDLVDLKSSYLENDAINLQITIQVKVNTSDVTFESISRSCAEGCWFEFQVTVSNIESLMAVKTPEFVLRKIPCKLVLFKHSKSLGIRLLSDTNRLIPQADKLFLELRARLVSSNVTAKAIKELQGTIGHGKKGLHILKFVSWDELLDRKNGYIKDGAISIEFKIKTEIVQDDSTLDAKKRRTTTEKLSAKFLILECKICNQAIIEQDVSSLPCGHIFCSTCITESVKARKMCPVCKTRANQTGLRQILLSTSD